MKKIPISFDFDGCLERVHVQNFVSILHKSAMFEIWIVTSRFTEEEFEKRYFTKDSNKDVFEVARKLDIPLKRIHFTNHEWKYKFVDSMKFLWHLDDSIIELDFINRMTLTKGISCLKSTYIRKCLKLWKDS
jgi:hypothetical protein